MSGVGVGGEENGAREGVGGGGAVLIVQMTVGATLSMHTVRVQLAVLLHVGTQDLVYKPAGSSSISTLTHRQDYTETKTLARTRKQARIHAHMHTSRQARSNRHTDGHRHTQICHSQQLHC